MANLDTAVAKAHKVKGPEEAARHYADVDTELGLGEYTEDQAEQGEEALRVLEQRYPGVRQRSHEKVAGGGHMPNLSRSANRNLSEPGAKPKVKARRDLAKRHPVAPMPKNAVRKPQPRRRSTSRSGSGVWQATGIPQTTLSWSQLGMRTLGGIAGLSFLGLLLSKRGSAAVSLTGSGLAHGLEALVNPAIDPFRAGSLTKAAAPAVASVIRPPVSPPIAQAPLHTQG